MRLNERITELLGVLQINTNENEELKGKLKQLQSQPMLNVMSGTALGQG